MGQVFRFIQNFVRRHLETYGIVVWYDPQGLYAPVVAALEKEVQVLHYQGSYLTLRHAADAALEAGSTTERLGETFPRLLIYLPIPPEETHHALVELETAGVVLAPGQRPDPRTDMPRNTDLAFLAQAALQDHLPEAMLRQVVAEIAAGKLGLEEVDHLVRPPEVPVALSTFYQTRAPEELLLAFLTGGERDADLRSRGLLEDFEGFLRTHLGLERLPKGDPARLRAYVASHLLVTEAAVVSGTVEEGLWHGLPVLPSFQGRELAVRTVQRWRRDRNLTEAYTQWARKVASQVSLPLEQLADEALMRVETFPQVDALLLERWAEDLASHAREADFLERLLPRLQKRRRGFWPQQEPSLALRWEVLLKAAEVFRVALKVHRALRKGRVWKVEELVQAYTEGEVPWYRLDQVYRGFEAARDGLYEEAPSPAFRKLVHQVRRIYRDTLHRMAERFQKAWMRKKGEDLERIPAQREVFRRFVWPLVQDRHRVAYILLDALRYDLVAEFLAHRLEQEDLVQDLQLSPALGTLPAMTPVGMAALLPGAEGSLGLREDRGNPVAEVEGRPLATQEDRVAFLAQRMQQAGRSFAHRKLEQLYTLSDRELESLKQVDVLLVTAEEMDRVAENLQPGVAQTHFLQVLRRLWPVLRRLAEAGFEHVILTTDHGFLLFGAPLEESEKVEAPQGKTLKVGRRYWIGREAQPSPSYWLVTSVDLGLLGDLTFAFPNGVSAFRAPGGHAYYYHGGLSLQELVLPVVRIRLRTATEPQLGDVHWSLEPISPRMTGRLVRLVIRAEARQLFRPPQRVRLEVDAGGRPLPFRVVDASIRYNEVLDMFILEPSEPGGAYPRGEVTLLFTELPSSGTVRFRLVNADTGAALTAPVPVPVDIAIR